MNKPLDVKDVATLAKPVSDEETSTTAVSDWPLIVPLRKPIRGADTEMIDKLTFQEPTPADFILAGMPIIWANEGVVMDTPKMNAMIQRLSKVPAVFLEKMDARDWMTCATKLMRFFLEP